ncbi:MAG: DbpA RNA binding domain-containing protein [Treponema sp.]|nr:DbpA RNA binding domain-containing protein [Treponema sp.]
MGYYNNNRENEISEEKAADFLENALRRIETEEDIDTLTKMLKVFKKTIPLTRRKYLTAYMLKEALKHYHSSFTSRNSRNSNRKESKVRNTEAHEYKKEIKAKVVEAVETVETEERARHPRVEIDPDKATSIFVSIGKNRRVYPRDLVGILIAVAGIDRDRIGDIKVLANYSFIQLYTEDAQTAIDKLNGYDYRGRKLAVSYSRQKGDAEDDLPTDGNISSGYEGDYPTNVSEEVMAAEDAAAYAAAEKAAADKKPFGNI